MIFRLFWLLLLTIILTLSGAFYFLGMTTAGLKMELNYAKKYLPGELTIKEISGTLLSDFTLQDISYQSVEENIQVKTFHVAWSPYELFHKKITINSIVIDQADIILQQTGSSPKSQSTVDLSWLRFVSLHEADFNRVTIKNADSEIHLHGTLTQYWNMSWDANIPQLSQFLPNATGSLVTTGKMFGDILTPTIQAELHGKNFLYEDYAIKNFNGLANIVIKPKVDSTLKLNLSDITILDYKFKKFDLNITGHISREKHELLANLNIYLNKNFHFISHIILPNYTGLSGNQAINATIHADITQLDLLTTFVPQIKNPSGNLKADFLVSGMLGDPKLTGDLALTNGKVHVPVIGITPDSIQAKGQFINNSLNFAGTFHSGQGIGQIKGAWDLNTTGLPVSLTVQGSELQAISLPEYKVTITPNVQLSFAKNNLDLQGKIDIPYAKITPKNFSDTVMLPEEVTFVGQKKVVTFPFTTSLQLDINLGDKIHVVYDNLEADLAGGIHIAENPGSVTTAAGILYTTEGQYKAYGQKLAIEKNSRLIYTGGIISNPGLNIAAVKHMKTIALGNTSSFSTNTGLSSIYNGSENLTVGVRVAGTLNNPAITLFSIPAMSQGDTLSYLVLGYPQAQASGQQAGAILSALSALNPNAGTFDNVTDQLQKTLGVTDLNVGSTQVFDPNTNSVVTTTTVGVGKQLAPNLSVHYSVGLFYPISILNLRYQLSKRWAIQSESSTLDYGADLLYSIERD